MFRFNGETSPSSCCPLKLKKSSTLSLRNTPRSKPQTVVLKLIIPCRFEEDDDRIINEDKYKKEEIKKKNLEDVILIFFIKMLTLN